MIRRFFHISADDSIHKVQENFSELFPSMQINFFLDGNKNALENRFCIMLSPEVKMRNIISELKDVCIEIRSEMTISELEHLIKENIGLHAEIFFRGENVHTTPEQADHWYLKDLLEVERPNFSNLPFRRIDSRLHA